MYSIDTIFLYLNIFSILFVLRVSYKFISALLSNPPMKLIMKDRELIFFGISLAYVITYLITL
jgi:hypothetical protein